MRAAWQETDEDDAELRAVLALLFAHVGAENGPQRVLETLDALDDESDADGRLRFALLQALAEIGAPETGPGVIRYLDHTDPGLQQVAAAGLQNFPGEASVDALVARLVGGSLALRGQAAISLAHLGDASGAAVLRDLVDPLSYELERKVDPTQWTRAEVVQYSRLRGLAALSRLGLPEDRGLFERLADEEPDLEVRDAAMRALVDAGGE